MERDASSVLGSDEAGDGVVSGPWQQKIFIYEPLGTQCAMHLRSPLYPISPLPPVALSAFSDETAPLSQGHCKSCQIPLDKGGSLSRKIIRDG